MPLSSAEIGARVVQVRARIAAACRDADRDPGNVQLVAVSKGHPVEAVRAAAAAGIADFAENYLHELEAKAPELPELQWHFQGALQRRKIRTIVAITNSVLSVGRGEELLEIEKRTDRPVACYLEVNIAREPTKKGAMPEDLENLIATARGLSRIRLEGLMAIPPAFEAASDAGKAFAAVRDLARLHGLEKVSMGMSDDFESAIAAGATMVRIGTAIFGPRS